MGSLCWFSVSPFINKIIIHPFPQVLFTADLKSFSSYGLESPSSALLPSNSSIPKERAEEYLQPPQSVLDLQTPPPSSALPPSNLSAPEERAEEYLQPSQSVSGLQTPPPSSALPPSNSDKYLQLLQSDLGLQTPPSSSALPRSSSEKYLQSLQSVQTPPVTPSVSPLKRKRDSELGDDVRISPVDIAEAAEIGAAETWKVDDWDHWVGKKRR